MLSRTTRILNFDHSLTSQNQLRVKFNPQIVDLINFSSSARHWLSSGTARQISNILKPQDKHAVTLIGSGDYHHISSLLIRQFQQPLSLIVFDFHPDWDIMPPSLGCGSWVNDILKDNNIKKVILIGVSSEDISTFRIQAANLGALKNNRLEIYPWQHRPARVIFRKVPDNLSLKVTKGLFSSRIDWHELAQENLSALFADILQRISTREVYVSIDKDCLRIEDSLTNWEEGCLRLEQLLLILKLIKDRFDITGLDITGDYSEPRVKNIFKKIALSLDHPKDYSAYGKAQSLIDATNEKTNIRILELLRS